MASYQSTYKQFSQMTPPDPNAFLRTIWPTLDPHQQELASTLLRRAVVSNTSQGQVSALGTALPRGNNNVIVEPPRVAPTGTIGASPTAPITTAGPNGLPGQFDPKTGLPTGTTPGANAQQPSSMLPSTGLRDPNSINAVGGSSNLTGPVQTIGYDPVAHAAANKAGVSYAYSGGAVDPSGGKVPFFPNGAPAGWKPPSGTPGFDTNGDPIQSGAAHLAEETRQS